MALVSLGDFFGTLVFAAGVGDVDLGLVSVVAAEDLMDDFIVVDFSSALVAVAWAAFTADFAAGFTAGFAVSTGLALPLTGAVFVAGMGHSPCFVTIAISQACEKRSAGKELESFPFF
jgi:hypothetical protein